MLVGRANFLWGNLIGECFQVSSLGMVLSLKHRGPAAIFLGAELGRCFVSSLSVKSFFFYPRPSQSRIPLPLPSVPGVPETGATPLHFLQTVNTVFGKSESRGVGFLFPLGAPRVYGLMHFPEQPGRGWRF